MPRPPAISLSDQNTVLSQNKRIHRGTVAAHEKLERKLKKLGVEIKPSFNIEPPLGRYRTGCYSNTPQVFSNKAIF